MKLESLHLKNFRTYENLNLDFESRLAFITGRNASGKTNIIEAIGLLSQGKSFRGATDDDMIRAGQEGYFASAKYRRGASSNSLEYGCERSGLQFKRKIKMNGKTLSGRSSLIGNLITVIFSPSDILIADGGPSYRRRFLDSVLSSQDRDYLKSLIMYNRSLRQRNAVLKSIREKRGRLFDLDVWDQAILPYAKKITETRLKFIADFQSIFQQSLARISDSRDDLTIHLEAENREDNLRDFAETLKKSRLRDTAAGHTTSGPHRNSLKFLSGGRDLLHFASQGQKRSLVLALRIAQFYFLKNNLGFSPVLLIDDVIRELDAGRRSAFVEILHESGQALFTTPDLDGLEDFLAKLSGEISIYNVTGHGTVDRARHG